MQVIQTPHYGKIRDVDYEDIQYYSFDVSASYLDDYPAKFVIHADKSTPFSNIINDICALTKGAFFIDKGAEKIDEEPVRRIKFVILQPRNVPSELRVLSETRLHGPRLRRSVQDVKNFISVDSFPFDTSSDKYGEVDTYTAEDTNSSGVYGIKTLALNNKPGDKVFYMILGVMLIFCQHIF